MKLKKAIVLILMVSLAVSSCFAASGLAGLFDTLTGKKTQTTTSVSSGAKRYSVPHKTIPNRGYSTQSQSVALAESTSIFPDFFSGNSDTSEAKATTTKASFDKGFSFGASLGVAGFGNLVSYSYRDKYNRTVYSNARDYNESALTLRVDAQYMTSFGLASNVFVGVMTEGESSNVESAFQLGYGVSYLLFKNWKFHVSLGAGISLLSYTSRYAGEGQILVHLDIKPGVVYDITDKISVFSNFEFSVPVVDTEEPDPGLFVGARYKI